MNEEWIEDWVVDVVAGSMVNLNENWPFYLSSSLAIKKSKHLIISILIAAYIDIDKL